MSTIELKERLIEKIQTTTNNSILEEVYRLLEIENRDLEVYLFTDEEKEKINLTRAQVKTGKYLTNDEANKEIDQWLEK